LRRPDVPVRAVSPGFRFAQVAGVVLHLNLEGFRNASRLSRLVSKRGTRYHLAPAGFGNDTGYTVGNGLNNFKRIVFRSAINNDVFDFTLGLLVNRGDTTGIFGGAVVSNGDDGNLHSGMFVCESCSL